MLPLIYMHMSKLKFKVNLYGRPVCGKLLTIVLGEIKLPYQYGGTEA